MLLRSISIVVVLMVALAGAALAGDDPVTIGLGLGFATPTGDFNDEARFDLGTGFSVSGFARRKMYGLVGWRVEGGMHQLYHQFRHEAGKPDESPVPGLQKGGQKELVVAGDDGDVRSRLLQLLEVEQPARHVASAHLDHYHLWNLHHLQHLVQRIPSLRPGRVLVDHNGNVCAKNDH